MTVCPLHGWSTPCLSCLFAYRAIMDRTHYRGGLGAIGGSLVARIAEKMRADKVWPHPAMRRGA